MVELTAALQPLIEILNKSLDLMPEKRRRTILWIYSGQGSLDILNWILTRGYQIHCRNYWGKQAEYLAESVQNAWVIPITTVAKSAGQR